MRAVSERTGTEMIDSQGGGQCSAGSRVNVSKTSNRSAVSPKNQ